MSTATATATARSELSGSVGITPEAVREILAAYQENPASEIASQEALVCRRRVAEQIAQLPAANKAGPALDSARTMIKLFAESGLSDYPVSDFDLETARGYRKRGWPGLVASMLLVPSWQWPDAPSLQDVPQWLWDDYAQYVFYAPKGFTAVGQAEAYAAHALKRLEELAKLANANRGSSAVRAAITAYLRMANCTPLYFAPGSLRRHHELRGQILTIAAGVKPGELPLPQSRAGRKLRVGFVSRQFGPRIETYTTLPRFEQLDPEEFEVHLFVQDQTNAPVETYARHRAAGFRVLPPTIDEQVAFLRAAELDIVVFGSSATAVTDDVTRLALYRLAPLQVLNSSASITSGLPEVDLVVSGDLIAGDADASDFTERLGLLSGLAQAFNYDADVQEPKLKWTRATLGVSEDAMLFVTTANYFKIIPEMQHAWAKLLATVPGSRLLVHPFNPNWSSEYPIQRFSADFDRVLASYGVSSDRFLLSTAQFPTRSEVKELLRVGDVYLDAFPFGGINSLIDPLQVGLPVVAWEGTTCRSRTGSALLRSLGLADCVATDESSYLKICAELATDKAKREMLKERVATAFVHPPAFMDTLAASDGFGALLQHAFDLLYEQGADAFRRDCNPIRVPAVSDPEAVAIEADSLLGQGYIDDAARMCRAVLNATPTASKARQVLGRALVAQGRPRRAVDYLIAAVEHVDNDAALWLDLSQALHADGRRPQAVEALETSLRIDRGFLDGWLFMGQLARESANYDLLQQIKDIVRQLGPNDPRVAQFAIL